MGSFIKIGVICSLFCLLTVAEQLRFDNYRVYSLDIQSQQQFESVQQLESADAGYEIWNHPQSGHGRLDIMVPPRALTEFLEFLTENVINATVKIENLQKLIDNEQRPTGKTTRSVGWEQYHTLEEIYDWLDVLLETHSNVLTHEVVGQSYEQRDIRSVKLSHKAGNKAIIIEANIHAREWITSATATYVLNELLTSTDPETRDIAENVDWYIIPVANPDGFTYTKTTNRLWRKTRSPHFHLCYGVDLNRNFGFQWMSAGASQNPCSETYAGPEQFSESEARALAAYYEKYKDQVTAYLAFHSYSQKILLPYGYSTIKAANHREMLQIGEAAATAIGRRFGTEYEVGSTADILYPNSGSSRDWAKGVHNVNVTYTIEFRDTGYYGFVLPPEQILPNSLEIFDALKAIVKECRTLGYL